MKQLIQDLNSSYPQLIDIPIPSVGPNEILIKTSLSLISSGTEKMIIDFAKSNILDKVKSQPEKVSQLIKKASNEGVFSAYESVQARLNKPITLGYSNVGIVKEVGSNVVNFNVGDRVISNGDHAEYVSVPSSLCSLVPPSVKDEDAVFTVLASIALEGIRLLKPNFGEKVVVSGLGLIGLLTVQILIANGLEVYAIDIDEERCNFASKIGAKSIRLTKENDTLSFFKNETNNSGVDGVILTCATDSSSPLQLASQICRKRAKIILVGTCDINIQRELFYKKELSFQVSCSYGPGRYDKSYEDNCNDYPIGYVRWTENRNFEAILSAVERGILKPSSLISNVFNFLNYESAYNLLFEKKSCLGIVLNFQQTEKNNSIKNIKINSLINENNNIDDELKLKKENQEIIKENISTAIENINIGFIGAGNFASRFLIPNFNRNQIFLNTLCAKSGINSYVVSKKFNFSKITTDPEDIFSSKEINTVVIASRHDSHCEYILKSLAAGKNIYVEKPLCLSLGELNLIKKAYIKTQTNQTSNILMVGFNRRFSPLIEKLKGFLNNIECPKSFVFLCNAGNIPNDHWLNDNKEGGGRILGEACHFVDLIRFLAASKIKDLSIEYLKDNINSCPDSSTINISFENGSIGTIHYFSNGSNLFPKERLEVFCQSKIFRLDNFRKLEAWGLKGFKKKSSYSINKGIEKCTEEFIKSINLGLQSPIKMEEIIEVHERIIKAL